MTPAQVYALVKPLWDADPTLRPVKADDFHLTFIEYENGDTSWRYVASRKAEELVCFREEAAERNEFAIDRALEAEAAKRDGWIVFEPPSRDVDRWCVYCDWTDMRDDERWNEIHPHRLVAKARLLASLRGVTLAEEFLR